MKSRCMMLGVLVLIGASGQSAIARNERVPPPRTYISSGGLGDSEPWLPTPDDPSRMKTSAATERSSDCRYIQ